MALKPRLNTPDKPLVSMMVFNYNYGRYLRECLDSLLAQTYDNIEICFSDNASTDDSWEIALEYQKRYPDVIFVARNRQNFGTDANFANCWTNARGKYFVEVCSDDALLADFTERCVKALEEHVDAGFAMVHRTILDEHGKHVIEAPFYNQTCKIPGAGQAAVYMMAAVNPAVTQIMYRKLFTFGKSVTGGLAGRWYGTRMMDFKMCCEFPIVYIKEPLMLHRLHLGNDSFKAASNMMEVVGPYVLHHQFAEIAAAYKHHNVIERLPASIEKVASLALRYSVRDLIAGNERNACRYLDIATAFFPEIRESETCTLISSYWATENDEARSRIVNSLETKDNLVTRSVSYDPPPVSITHNAAMNQIHSSLAADDALCYFGVGALLEACFDQLVLATGRRPDFLCDNDPAKWDQAFHDVPCISPDRLPADRERTAIVICIRNHEAAECQLRTLGYRRIWLVNFSRGYHCVSGLRELGIADPAPASPPPLDLKGRWALITGATRGIGRTIAEALAERGLNIVCHGKTVDSSQRACQALADFGVETLPVAADLSRLEEIDHFCAWVAESAPSLSVVYNNAGISPHCAEGFWKMGNRDFIDCYTVNTLAPIRICQTLIPAMRRRGFGRIVNVSSSIQKRPGEMAYACSKAALDKFVHDLSPSLAGSGVMLSLLDSGWLSTDMGGPSASNDVDSVLPGGLLGALVDGNVNGLWFSAQDYRGLTIESAIRKARDIGAFS